MLTEQDKQVLRWIRRLEFREALLRCLVWLLTFGMIFWFAIFG